MKWILSRNISLYLIALLYVAAGINHFIRPLMYAAIIPPILPAPFLLVYVSGLAEIGLGLLMLPVKTRAGAAWLLIVLLVLVFPANIYMAWLSADRSPLMQLIAWLRLPVQGLLIWWAYTFTRPTRSISYSELAAEGNQK